MSTPLQYAAPLPWYRGRRAQRTVVRLLIVSAITCAGVWAWRFASQINYILQQARSMQLTASPDTVIWPHAGALGFPTAQLEDLNHIWMDGGFDVFIHGRRVAGEGERIVMVRCWNVSGGKGIHLYWNVEACATLQLGSRVRSQKASGTIAIVVDRLFAGQPDPADESHFTIRFELDGKSNIIDGWLMPDDTVKLEPRH